MKQVNIRIEPADYLRWGAHATAAGLSVPAFVRQLVEQHLATAPPPSLRIVVHSQTPEGQRRAARAEARAVRKAAERAEARAARNTAKEQVRHKRALAQAQVEQARDAARRARTRARARARRNPNYVPGWDD